MNSVQKGMFFLLFLLVQKMYVRKSEYEMSDSIFDFGDQKKGKFYSVESADFDLRPVYNGVLVDVNIVIDPTEDFYNRKVYNIFDYTGQIGGLYEILSIIGGIIVTFFSDKILMLSLMSNLYQVEGDKEAADPATPTQNFQVSKVVPVSHMFEEEKNPQTLHDKVNIGDAWADEQHSQIEGQNRRFDGRNRQFDEHRMLTLVIF
jgi:hypothetical protein